MNVIKAIRTEEDYNAALELLESLIDLNPDPDTDEANQLDILSVLIDKYEDDNLVNDIPNVIEAIEFFMDQKDLKPVDLVPYLGPKSRVSEILSGKRSLTVDMIRALEQGLGMPAKVLLKKPPLTEESLIENWDSRLFNEMEKRGYFLGIADTIKNRVDVIKSFLSNSGSSFQTQASLRQSNYRTAPTTDPQALTAWSVRVLSIAQKVDNVPKYIEGSIDLEFMHNIAKLSVESDGPIRAQDELRSKGIILIVEPHLPKTRLDGAVLSLNGAPVIGVTLRYDRMDNFWFTLMHELAHIYLHFNKQETNTFFDELDKIKGMEIDDKEAAADSIASEALVPADIWSISPARLIPSPLAARSLADEVGVDISIIAGKIRYENGNWNYLKNIVSEKTVRNLFPDIGGWNESK